jgi:hypothetical protein
VGATALVVFLTGYRVVTGIVAARERAARPAPGSGPLGAAPVRAPGLPARNVPQSTPAISPLDLRAPHRPPVGIPDQVLPTP